VARGADRSKRKEVPASGPPAGRDRPDRSLTRNQGQELDQDAATGVGRRRSRQAPRIFPSVLPLPPQNHHPEQCAQNDISFQRPAVIFSCQDFASPWVCCWPRFLARAGANGFSSPAGTVSTRTRCAPEVAASDAGWRVRRMRRKMAGRGLIFLLTKLGGLLWFAVDRLTPITHHPPFYLATPTSTHLRHHLKFFSLFIDPTPCCRVSSSPVLPEPTSPDSPPLVGADDSNLRPLIVNVPVICFMKKIITTLVIVAAAAVGAQGQTTFPVSGTNAFSNLTFSANSTNAVTGGYIRARLLFGISGFNLDAEEALVRFRVVTLSGQGLTGDQVLASGTPATFDSAGAAAWDYNNEATWARTTTTTFTNVSNPPVTDWSSTNNRANFQVQMVNGAFANPGAQIFYAVSYIDSGGFQFNTGFGNVTLTAVPEPSAYAAAAGLLALCLWSSRRQLVKLIGARSSASGPGENGAA